MEDDELADEAVWLEARMAEEGRPIPADILEHVVRLHRAYLAIAPSDEAFEGEQRGGEPGGDVAEPWQRRAPDEARDNVEPDRAPPPAAPDDAGIRHEVRGG